MPGSEAFETAQNREPGLATNIDFTLRRVNLSHCLDITYNPKLTAVFICSLYAAAVTACRFENHVVGQLAPLLLATLLVSVPLFLFMGGTIMKRGINDQTKWALQCLVADPAVELWGVVSRRPIASFVFVSLLAEVSKLLASSMWAIAVGATALVAFRWYKGRKVRR
eukprot:GILI01022016.1.p1 GENE.GILI01022016.1~~GILI01022016.1.p1  ORF type:complete len:167 (-),score=27.13 GILI01022016.1:72-572(-)